jgi:HEAT repeat protein
MNCQDIRRLLDQRNLASLSRAETGQIESHLWQCESCSAQWQAHQQIAQFRAAVPAVPQALVEQLGTLAGAAGSPASRRFRRPVIVGSLLVFGVAAAYVGSVLLGTDTNETGGQPVIVDVGESVGASEGAADPSDAIENEPDDDVIVSEAVEPESEAAAIDRASGPVVAILPLVRRNFSPLAWEVAERQYETILGTFESVPEVTLIGEAETYRFEPLIPERARLTDDLVRQISAELGAEWVVLFSSEGNENDPQFSFSFRNLAAVISSNFGWGAGLDGLRDQEEALARQLEQRVLDMLALSVPSVRERQFVEGLALIADGDLPFFERHRALNDLIRLSMFPEEDWTELRSEPMGEVLVYLALDADDVEDQSRIWGSIRRIENPFLGPAMQEALIAETSDVIRASIAVTLAEQFADEAGVEEVLTDLRLYDVSLPVRYTVARLMQSDDAALELIRSVVLNSALSDRQRLQPFLDFEAFDDSMRFPIDEDIGQALIDLSGRASDAGVRAAAAGRLGDYGVPEAIERLTVFVESDADERVRLAAGLALIDHLDKPGVRETLETVRQSDPSREVTGQLGLSMIFRDARPTGVQFELPGPPQ